MMRLLGLYERKSVAAGEIFIREGDEGYEAYLIQSGRVRVFTHKSGHEITYAEIGSGNIVGEAALIMNEPRSASVQALEATTLVVITRDNFNKMMAKTDQTIQSVLKLLTGRVMSQNTETVDKELQRGHIDSDAAAITKSFTRGMNAERSERFIAEVGPHMSALIKALKDFKSGG